MARIGLKQFGKTVVIDWGAGQCPADVLGHVIVTEGDRVGIPQGPMSHFGTRPYADAGECL